MRVTAAELMARKAKIRGGGFGTGSTDLCDDSLEQ